MTASCPPERADLVVIGATGWIGAATLSAARARGTVAIGLARRPGPHVLASGITPDELTDALRTLRPSAVINCAGVKSGDTTTMHDVNVGLVATLCQLAETDDFRVVQVGSAAEYGDPGTNAPIAELAPLRPLSPYGRTKAEASELVLSVPGGVVARLFNMTGPTPGGSWLLADIVRRVEAAAEEVVLESASQQRDWITLPFAVEALLRLAAADVDPGPVNVCSGTPVTNGTLATAVATHLEKRLAVTSRERPGIAAVIGDPSRLGQVVGLRSTSTVADIVAAALVAP